VAALPKIPAALVTACSELTEERREEAGELKSEFPGVGVPIANLPSGVTNFGGGLRSIFTGVTKPFLLIVASLLL